MTIVLDLVAAVLCVLIGAWPLTIVWLALAATERRAA